MHKLKYFFWADKSVISHKLPGPIGDFITVKSDKLILLKKIKQTIALKKVSKYNYYY